MPTNTKQRIYAGLTALAVTAAVSGCASAPLNTSETGAYDGWWLAKIQKTPPKQTRNNWEMTCRNLEGEFAFDVSDDIVRMKALGSTQHGLLTSGGKFKLRQQTDFKVSSSARSDIQITKGDVRYVIKGKLSGDKPHGIIQTFIPEIGAGCTSKIHFVREKS